jgi:hypothetical protein
MYHVPGSQGAGHLAGFLDCCHECLPLSLDVRAEILVIHELEEMDFISCHEVQTVTANGRMHLARDRRKFVG